MDQLLAAFQLSTKPSENSIHGGAGSLSFPDKGILRTPQTEHQSLSRPTRLPTYTGPSASGTQAENEASRIHHFQPKPKIKLTTFNGTNARFWVRKCNRYFNYYTTPDRDKVQVTALYFDEKVEWWFNNFIVGKAYVSWDELSRALLSKYDKLDYGQVIGLFNKLRQTGSLNSYIDSFEDLRARMLEFNPMLTEAHFLHSFVYGLQDGIRHSVLMFKPQTLEDVYELAENEEKKLEALRRRGAYSRGSNQFQKTTLFRLMSKGGPEGKPVTDSRSPRPNQEFKKGQCFKCGDK